MGVLCFLSSVFGVYITDLGGNPSTSFMLMFALLAGVVGVCSLLSGLIHLRAWRSDSLASAASLSSLSWVITAIAFGYFLHIIIFIIHHSISHEAIYDIQIHIIIMIMIHVQHGDADLCARR